MRDETLHFLLGLVANRLDAQHVPALAGALMNKRFGTRGPLRLGHAGKQTGSDKHVVDSVARGDQDYARGFGLIVEPFARGSENKEQNQRDHDVVLPGCAREIPEKQAAAEAESRHIPFACHYGQFNTQKGPREGYKQQVRKGVSGSERCFGF